ncbi:MAG: hypothetical protein ABI668_00100 [Sphingorhabdus sp.]
MSQFVDRHYRSLLLLVWLLGCALLLVSCRVAIAEWRMGDPDDQLRIVQVRDWIAGQSWWDITQYRMNPPDGGPMHWSRLVDVPIAAVILLLRPFLGQMLAEQSAAALVPLLTLGIVLIFYAATVRRLFGSIVALLAALLFLTILPAIAQLVPMRIDHHGWQLALFFVASWALFDRTSPVRAAVIIGVALALWIEISIEGLPFAAVFLGLLALRWVTPTGQPKNAGEEWSFAVSISALAIGAAVFFGITESWSETRNYCDSLSPVHVAIFAVMAMIISAAAGCTLIFRRPLPVLAKLAIAGGAGLAGIAVLLMAAPQCAGDAFAELDPLVRQYWFMRVPEGMPLWSVQLDFAIQQIAGLVGGFIGLVYLLFFSKRPNHEDKLLLSLLFLGCAVVGSFVSRTAVYAVCLATLMLAPMVVGLFQKAESLNSLTTRMAIRVLAMTIGLPTLVGQNVMNQINAAADADLVAKDEAFKELALECQSLTWVTALNRLPPAQLMAGLDTSPSILQATHHKVIATGHHRNQVAMADVIRTFTGSVQQAETIFREHKVQYLVTCDGSFEMQIYAHRAPDGFLAQIKQGDVPNWLTQQPDIGPFHIFKVNFPAAATLGKDSADNMAMLR